VLILDEQLNGETHALAVRSAVHPNERGLRGARTADSVLL